MNIRQRVALWLDPTPERIAVRQYDALLKAARRCMHDLDHCASDVSTCAPFMSSTEWHERAADWHRVFYPDGGPKDYVTRIEREYEDKLIALRQLCLENGIDPYSGDIPF